MAPNKIAKDTPRTQPPPSTGAPDPATDAIAGLYARWILPYSWRVALLILGVLVCVALVKTMAGRRGESDGAAFAALSKAESTDALLAVARDHDGTAVAARAQLEAARRLYDEGKYDQAMTKFALARKAAGSGAGAAAVAVAASLGEAYATEASGKPEAAEKSFADTAGTVPSEALALDAWLGAGRCAKAQGKLAEAEKYYGKAKQAAGDSPFARRRVDEASAALSSARYAQRPEEPAKAADPAAPPAAAPAAATPPPKP
jgi:tetratricopeptide (TPR) repeat protein